MFKFLGFFVEVIFWLQFFIGPVIVGGLIGLFIYARNGNLLWLSILLCVIGIIGGIVYAEWVRRNKGASRYAAKIRATPDVWPDEYPEEIEGREKNSN